MATHMADSKDKEITGKGAEAFVATLDSLANGVTGAGQGRIRGITDLPKTDVKEKTPLAVVVVRYADAGKGPYGSYPACELAVGTFEGITERNSYFDLVPGKRDRNGKLKSKPSVVVRPSDVEEKVLKLSDAYFVTFTPLADLSPDARHAKSTLETAATLLEMTETLSGKPAHFFNIPTSHGRGEYFTTLGPDLYVSWKDGKRVEQPIASLEKAIGVYALTPRAFGKLRTAMESAGVGKR